MKKLLLAILILSSPVYATVFDTSSGRVSYVGDGASVTYFFTFPVTSKDFISASVTVAGGTVSSPFTVVLNADQTNEPGGTVFFSTAPANSAAIVITRTVPLNQPLLLNPFSNFPAKAVERQFDYTTQQIQQLDRDRADLAAKEAADLIGIGAGSNNTPIVATGEPTARTPADRFADIRNVRGWGTAQDNVTDDSARIQNAINANHGIVFVPGSDTNCYFIGTTTILLKSNVWVAGEGSDGVSQGATCFIYTGTGCAILGDSVREAMITGIDVRVNSTSSTARAFCLAGSTSTAINNTIANCSARQINATNHIAGQYGFLLDGSGNHGVYWNHINDNVAYNWGTAYELRGKGSIAGGDADGANNNWVFQNIAYSSVVGLEIWKGADNVVNGFSCSRSDGTFTGNITCLLLGDATAFGDFNSIEGVDNDTGSPAVCGVVGAGARGNKLSVDCESGGSITDNNISVPFPTTIFELLGGKLRIGKITTANGAQFASYGSAICTTAASIGATCTSGPLTTVTTFPDTLYTALCSLNTVTGQPHIVSIQKTTVSSINVTIAADTAAAASAKVDCYFNHF